MSSDKGITPKGLGRYLSPLSAWALSFGCAVGWGAFIMPGTAFLPVAGPLGTLIGLGVGALVMFLVGRNYHYLIQNFPEAGGAYGYVKRVCGGDHGYICGWFLILTYVAIAWGNATALALIGRYLLGNIFSFGFRYEISGQVVYAGEILLSVVALLLVGGAFLCGKRLAARVLTVFALVLCAGIAVCVASILMKHQGGLAGFAPAFADGKPPALQIFAIVALAPWVFVGFESVSHSAEEFAFPRWRTVWIIGFSLLAAAAAYVALTLVAASACPPGFASWRDYMAARKTFGGPEAIPTFYAVKAALGGIGLAVLCLTTVASAVTGLVGFILAASRLLYAMSRDGLLFGPFAKLDRDGSPRNVIVAIIAVSCLIPFVGRTALGWIVNVTTIGASIAYGYVSFCTFMVARKEGRRWVMASGCAGVAISTAFIVYFLVPNFWVVDALATESYFILSAWCILGVIVFRRIFKHDESGRLGATTVAWLVLLFLIFFSSHMWNRQKTRDLTDRVVAEIKQRYMPIDKDGNVTKEEEDAASFLMVQKEWVNDTLTHYNMVQIALVLIALALIHSISSIISRREKEASKARSYFFSTISHDIRTPLNAIVGFSQMLKLGIKSNEEKEEAVNSILVSSKSLLSLVNDILDLSRRGSDKSDVTPVHTDCHALLHEIVQSFRVGSVKEGLEIRDKIGEMPQLLLDALRLRHTAFNIISNAVKFTERGFVEIRARFDRDPPDDPDDDQEEETGTLLVEVEDTGVGISDEDKHRIDMPYVQTASKISRHGGTGLGLAVCRQFTEAMGGTLTFDSELGKGSTFRITIPKVKVAHEAVVVEGIESETEEEVVSPHTPNIPLAHSPAPVPPAQPRLLLVDDQKMNLAVLRALVKRVGGFEIETAADGKEAFARLQNADAPKIDAVLTDMWMPDMDGAGLAKAIRADTKLAHLPVHVITADVELQETYAEKGFDSIILKPVTVATLSPLLVGIAEHKASAA